MKRTYSRILTGIFTFLLGFAVSAPAYAQTYTEIPNGGTITLNRSTQNDVWTFTAPFTGLLLVQSDSHTYYAGHTSGGTFLYTKLPTIENGELTGGEPVQVAIPPTEKPQGKMYTFAVTMGTTYYVKFDVLYLEAVKFTFTMQEGEIVPEIHTIYPESNTTSQYNFAYYPQVQIIFNVPGSVSFTGDTYMEYETADGGTATLYIEPRRPAIDSDFENRYDVDIYRAIMQVKSNLKKFSVFTLNLGKPVLDGEAVTGPFLNENGELVLKYLYGDLVSCISQEYPNPILSYWPLDSESGIMTFKFDADLLPQNDPKQRPTFMMFAGPYKEPSGEGDDSGWPQLPGAQMTIEGNTLTVDLRGVLRPAEDQAIALATLKETPIVSVWIQNLLDYNGNVVDYYSNSAIQIFDIPFTLLEKIDLMYELTPASGAINNVDEIELWIANNAFEHVRIDGFDFTAGELTETVSEFSVESDPFDTAASLIYVKVPESIKKTPGEINFSANLYSLDSYDYSIEATYTNPASAAVEEVEAAEGNYTVYGIDGTLLFKGDAARVNALPKGLYIINGKKVIK